MDIAEAFYNQHSLAWLSHLGVTPPQPFSNSGTNWLKTFGGGLLTTCGLDHVGGTEVDSFGERGLHGQISNTPAEIESISQPDILTGKMEMSIRGKMKQTQIFGPSYELIRTISGRIGVPEIIIQDEIRNVGNEPIPLMMLYHINFGWPLVDEGTEILWNGSWISREGEAAAKIFREGNNFRKCPALRPDHTGSGEEAAFISPITDHNGFCTCGLYNSKIGLAVEVKFDKNQLPWLINWQHWGEREYVTALEPATNPPTGQASARRESSLMFLEPGACKKIDLTLTVLDDRIKIGNLLKKFN